MTFTYLPQTNAGKVRLLCTDTEPDPEKPNRGRYFDDEEIGVFLALNDHDVRLAAAQALDQIAASQTLILKYIEINGLKTDGTRVAAALHAQAESLRAQAAAGDEAIGFVAGIGPQGVC